VLAAAAAQPDRLVVGVDANTEAMATASRRAAAKRLRGGLPNTLFLVAAAEALPAELDRVADLVTVNFPWGSLLRGLLGADPAIMAGVTRVLQPGGTAQLLLSSTARDRGAGVAPIQAATLEALAESYVTWGLAVTQLWRASVADVAAAHSTWGKRLGAGGRRRPAWLLRARLAPVEQATSPPRTAAARPQGRGDGPAPAWPGGRTGPAVPPPARQR
jgi:16S rRNA (adenine(1408)-N(1))-methyltransferase